MSYEDCFDYLTKKEEENAERTRKELSEEFELSKEALEMLHDCFKAILSSYSRKWSHSKKAALFLLPRLIMSTKASLELLTRGYYFDFMVVQRSLWESLALLKLLSKDEEAAKKWLNLERLELPKWKLMHQILMPSPPKKGIKLVNKMYAEQSDFIHSNFIAVISEWKRQLSRKKESLEFPKWRKSLIGEMLSTPSSLLTALILTDVFKEELEESLTMKVVNLAEEKVSEWEAEGFFKD